MSRYTEAKKEGKEIFKKTFKLFAIGSGIVLVGGMAVCAGIAVASALPLSVMAVPAIMSVGGAAALAVAGIVIGIDKQETYIEKKKQIFDSKDFQKKLQQKAELEVGDAREKKKIKQTFPENIEKGFADLDEKVLEAAKEKEKYELSNEQIERDIKRTSEQLNNLKSFRASLTSDNEENKEKENIR